MLDLGGSGAGYLNAAFGAGGVLGIAATATLVGRRRLMPAARRSARPSGRRVRRARRIWSTVGGTFVLLALAGAGRSLLDVAGRTLLQRRRRPTCSPASSACSRAWSMAGLAVGALLVPRARSPSAARAAAIVGRRRDPAACSRSLVGRRLLAVDSSATVPVVEIALLRSLPLFAPLGAPAIESLARSLAAGRGGGGETVIRARRAGRPLLRDRGGELEVSSGGETAANARLAATDSVSSRCSPTCPAPPT